jgi:hypothetical protein
MTECIWKRRGEIDRELLELAAKAAGLDTPRYVTDGFALGWTLPPYGISTESGPTRHRLWNPLTDDGDAFRLAMSLRMIVTPGTARLLDGRLFGKDKDSVEETRRAIVMAAAYIGRTMQ